jgi:diguanylate cyclase (GGDEF)-like protein
MAESSSEKLRRTVLLTLLGVVLALSLAFGALASINSNSTTYQDAIDLLAAIRATEARRVEGLLDGVRTMAAQAEAIFLAMYREAAAARGTLGDTGFDPDAVDACEPVVETALRAALEASGLRSAWLQLDSRLIGKNFNLSLYRDDSGAILRESPYAPYLSGHASDEWYSSALERGESWSRPYRWEPWDAEVITYSRRMELAGSPIGVVGAEFFMDDLTGELASIRILGSGYMVLLDAELNVIYHPDASMKNPRTDLGGSLRPLADAIRTQPGAEGIVEFEMAGRRKLFAYAVLSNGWVVAAAPYWDEIFARQRWLAFVLVAIAAVGLLAAVPLSIWLSRLVAAPMLALTADLERLALTDPLTGAYNRRFFISECERQIALSRRLGFRFSVVMFDLDHFKRVNDEHGHAAGDAALVAAAGAVRNNLRLGDVLGRLGGEEFYVLMPHASLGEGCAAAERLRQLIKSIDLTDGKGEQFRVTASFGVAQFKPTGSGLAELLGRVDEATYRSKDAGRDRVTAG